LKSTSSGDSYRLAGALSVCVDTSLLRFKTNFSPELEYTKD
jgi:hypothetical protein